MPDNFIPRITSKKILRGLTKKLVYRRAIKAPTRRKPKKIRRGK